MWNDTPEYQAGLRQLSVFFEDYIATHVEKIQSENDPRNPSVQAVRPLWQQLAEAPLRLLAAERMVPLLNDALRSARREFHAEQHEDGWLIVSVVPAYHNDDVRRHFGPDGYVHFTMIEAGAAEAASAALWVAHWTLCTTGRQDPAIHLTVIPSTSIRRAGRALMLWAQDLCTDTEWQELPSFVRRCLPDVDGHGQASPAVGPRLLTLGQQVVDAPEKWEAVVHAARTEYAQFFPRGELETLKEASAATETVAPHPLGFICTALAFEVVEAIDADETLLNRVCRWALCHPVYDERLMPIRIRLCERLLSSRQTTDPKQRAALKQTLGIAYLTSAAGDRAKNVEAAIGCFNTALRTFSRRRDPKSWAILKADLGRAYADRVIKKRSANLKLAIASYEDALTVFSRDDYPIRWAETCRKLGSCYAMSMQPSRADDLERSLEYLQQALSVLSRDETPEVYGETHRIVAGIYIDRIRGDLSENIEHAIGHAEEALSTFSSASYPTQWASLQNTLGNAFCDRLAGERAENLDKAIDSYRAALTIWTETSTPATWAMTLNNLGTAYHTRIRGDRDDNIEEAIQCFRAALTVRTKAHLPAEWAVTIYNLGSVFSDRFLGVQADNIEEAINCYEAALTVRTRDSSPVEWAMTQCDLGNVYIRRLRGDRAKNVEQAISHLNSALLVRTREVMPAEWARTWNNMGNAHRHRVRGNRTRNLAKAIRCYSEAAAVFQNQGLRREAVQSYRNLAQTQIERNDLKAACQASEHAARLLESELGESHTEFGRLEWLREESGVFDGLVTSHLLLGETERQTRETQDHIASASYWAEQGRARYLADLISTMEEAPGGADQETYGLYRSELQTLRDLDQQAHALEDRRSRLPRSDARRTQFDEEISHNQSLRDQKYQRVGALLTKLRQSDPHWDFGAAPLSTQAIQSVARKAGAALLTLRPTQWGTCVCLDLPDATTAGTVLKKLTTERVMKLLVRFDADRAAGGWVVTYDHLRKCRDEEECEARRWWHETIDDTLRQLGEVLWRPLRRWLAGIYPPTADSEMPRPLIVLPGLGLNILPLHAAWYEEGGSRKWTCDDYQISYAPSVRVLQGCLQRRASRKDLPSKLLAIRNPTGDLTCAGWEVDSVQSLFASPLVLGDARSAQPATCDRIVRELPRCQIALFSTHGRFDHTAPWQGTGLCTADHPRSDQKQPMLTLGRISQLRLSQLSLAVLSACESALTDYRDPAGEQMGIPSALLAAGADTTVGSLWVVDDLATALLIRRFFQEWFSTKPGTAVTKAYALWRAQRWLRNLTAADIERLKRALSKSAGDRAPVPLRAVRDMVLAPREDDQVSSDHPYSHPFYWSAFACYGAL